LLGRRLQGTTRQTFGAANAEEPRSAARTAVQTHARGSDRLWTRHTFSTWGKGPAAEAHPVIDGAYWTEELAVNGFVPTRVLAHTHCVIDAFELTDTTIEILNDKVTEYLAKNLGPDFLLPDIKTSAIQDQKGLFARIGYMLKPMKLLKA
jgi:hypothetical protein